ncbi:hypothetical protein CA830_08715 [Burkholderia multivorans]|nr:hypothetical protein BA763_16040 [Burkholderia cenocepacia]OXH89179.1 hypothetical protein CA831_14735 [Burkholderia multivorans]OXH93248.1 hypothetical protein CA830_08715 [Burkholderia multivorans]
MAKLSSVTIAFLAASRAAAIKFKTRKEDKNIFLSKNMFLEINFRLIIYFFLEICLLKHMFFEKSIR